MSKQIQKNRTIYVAPEIRGEYQNDEPVVFDDRNGGKKLDPSNVETKIMIYEREVLEWFLNPAKKLNNPNNSFIVLMVCMSYIEGVEQYKTGTESRGGGKQCFINSVNRIYPGKFSDNELKKLYSKSRCGLFHNGMVKGGVVVSSDDIVMEFVDNDININPSMLLKRLKEDFKSYIKDLQSSIKTNASQELKDLNENFDRMFTVI